MSNKDSNGFERPWALHCEQYTNGTGLIKLRHRIIPNQDFKHVADVTTAYALVSCAKDAIVHNVTDAQGALELHISDLHKWP